MKVKLALSVLVVLTICLLPGCRDYTSEEYIEAVTNYSAAQGQIVRLNAALQEKETALAELTSELETYTNEIADLETELETSQAEYQAQIADLEAELETLRADIADLEAELEASQPDETPTTEEPPPPPEPTYLQQEELRYRGYEGKLVSMRITMLEAAWNANTVTISWELANTCQRRIHLTLLSVESHDQMNLYGESGDVTPPLLIYSDLQDDLEMPWPGETVSFDTVWAFGPLSEDITIKFIVVRTLADDIKYAADDVLPWFYLTRPSD